MRSFFVIEFYGSSGVCSKGLKYKITWFGSSAENGEQRGGLIAIMEFGPCFLTSKELNKCLMTLKGYVVPKGGKQQIVRMSL